MKIELDKYILIKKLIVHLNKFKKIHKDDLSLKFLEQIKINMRNIILNNLETKLNLFFLKYEIDFCKFYSLKSRQLNNLVSVLEQNIKGNFENFENAILLEKEKILTFSIKLEDEEICFLKIILIIYL